MKKMLKAVAAVLALAISASFVACSWDKITDPSQNPPSAPANPGTPFAVDEDGNPLDTTTAVTPVGA